jgi:inner membrane protein
MEPVTHLLTGACLARTGLNRKAAYTTLAMVLAAEAPDFDTLWSLRGPVAAFQHHRGITHTFVALPFEALLVVGFVWLVHRWRLRRVHGNSSLAPDRTGTGPRPLTAAPVRWGLLYAFALIALLSHILLDWTNNYGVRPFFPFNPRWYKGSFVFIFEPLMFVVLLIGLVAPALFGLVGSEIGGRKTRFGGRGWAVFALVCVTGLWGWRWVQHDNAVQLATNAGYGEPGSAPAQVLRVTANPYPTNPYRWHTVVETPVFYQAATVDTLHSVVDTNPEQDLINKPQPTRAIEAADRSWLGRVYLDWSSWPLVSDIGPTQPEDAAPGSAGWTGVNFRDLRFQYDTFLSSGSNQPPLSAMVYVDSSGRVVQMQFGRKVQKQ